MLMSDNFERMRYRVIQMPAKHAKKRGIKTQ
jgi:hypothetical protein